MCPGGWLVVPARPAGTWLAQLCQQMRGTLNNSLLVSKKKLCNCWSGREESGTIPPATSKWAKTGVNPQDGWPCA